MLTAAFHRRRFQRMLQDLGIDPPSLLVEPDGTIIDDSQRRRLTPPLGNQTLAEGIVSAIKLAALAAREGGG